MKVNLLFLLTQIELNLFCYCCCCRFFRVRHLCFRLFLKFWFEGVGQNDKIKVIFGSLLLKVECRLLARGRLQRSVVITRFVLKSGKQNRM